MKTLKDLFLHELADVYDAEHRIAKALPTLESTAKSRDLKQAFKLHLNETKGHISKVEQVFDLFGQKASRETCDATVGLIEEGDHIAEEFEGSPAIDAALIAAAQKVEHYEMATYGCLVEWANDLDKPDAAAILQEILEEESATNKTLSKLAMAKANEKAMN